MYGKDQVEVRSKNTDSPHYQSRPFVNQDQETNVDFLPCRWLLYKSDRVEATQASHIF